MSEHYERGYTGHGRGVVVTNDGKGNFSERQMTAGEMAARAPAWAIGADPYEFLTRAAAFAYIRSWEVIAPAIDAALAAQAAGHDRRITDLLEANNREVERRRRAEASRGRLASLAHAAITRVDRQLDTVEGNLKYVAPWGELTALRKFLAAIDA